MAESIALEIISAVYPENGFAGTEKYCKYKLIAVDKSTGTKYVIWYKEGIDAKAGDEVIVSGGKDKWSSILNINASKNSAVVAFESIVQNKSF